MTMARAALPGSVGSVGLGVCVGSAPGRSEPGIWCRGKAAGGGSLWESWELCHKRRAGPDPRSPGRVPHP